MWYFKRKIRKKKAIKVELGRIRKKLFSHLSYLNRGFNNER